MFSSSLLPNPSLFPSEMGKRFPARYVALKEFAIGSGSTWSCLCCSGGRGRRRRNPDLSIICTGQVSRNEMEERGKESKVWQ